MYRKFITGEGGGGNPIPTTIPSRGVYYWVGFSHQLLSVSVLCTKHLDNYYSMYIITYTCSSLLFYQNFGIRKYLKNINKNGILFWINVRC